MTSSPRMQSLAKTLRLSGGTYRLQRPACMTAEQAAGFGSKNTWWVKSDSSGNFVPMWPRVPATEPLDLLVPLDCYTIGAGPPEHYRETLDLTAPPGVAPCIRRGCSGVVPFELEHTLTRVAEDDQDTPERLCSDCRGAA